MFWIVNDVDNILQNCMEEQSPEQVDIIFPQPFYAH